MLDLLRKTFMQSSHHHRSPLSLEGPRKSALNVTERRIEGRCLASKLTSCDVGCLYAASTPPDGLFEIFVGL